MKTLIADPVEQYGTANDRVRRVGRSAEVANAASPCMGSMDMERRDLTVLVADVVNYCHMIETDDVKTVLHLEQLRKHVIGPIASNRGADVIRGFGGDGLVISFTDPHSAICCAVDLQARVRVNERQWPIDERIRFRMGIATGSVLLFDGNLHGCAVNVAARLQALADPGDVWVTSATRRQIRKQSEVGFEAMGIMRLRNIMQDVAVYRASRKSVHEVVD